MDVGGESQMTMGRDKRRAAVAMAVVFVAGAIVGLAATRVYHHRHGGMGGRLSAPRSTVPTCWTN